MPRADNLRAAAVLIAISTAFAAGCGEDGATRPGLSNNSSPARPGAVHGADNARDGAQIASGADYWGEDWEQQAGIASAANAEATGTTRATPRTFGAGVNPTNNAAAENLDPPRKPDPQKPKAKQPPSEAKPQDQDAAPSDSGKKATGEDSSSADSTWSLVVATFTDGDHVAAAQRMISEMRNVAPQVRGLRVHPTSKGSMVVYGNYANREDPQARTDIDWLKSLKFQNTPVFPRVILTHLDLRPLKGELHPYNLLSARRKHPKVDPLYTLDVAMWDDFDSEQMTYADVRRKAETYAAQLRQQGVEAYFYHDDVNERSLVTVGLFDRTAINQRSGLYTTNVTDLIKKFPQRLVNGEPMFEYVDRFQPGKGTKPQTPVLVLVPAL